jgi:hypothetical protein
MLPGKEPMMATMPTQTVREATTPTAPPEHTTRAAFLARHPVVHDLLVEAEAPVRAAFGADATLAWAVETDPEIVGWEYVVTHIETTLPQEHAARCLEAFDTAWWLAQGPRAVDLCLIDLKGY